MEKEAGPSSGATPMVEDTPSRDGEEPKSDVIEYEYDMGAYWFNLDRRLKEIDLAIRYEDMGGPVPAQLVHQSLLELDFDKTDATSSSSTEAEGSLPIAPLAARAEKRLAWTKEEDGRLMSVWLYTSDDPVIGNDKNSEQYWGNVVSLYNGAAPIDRRISVKQAKEHWHSLSLACQLQRCCNNKASAMHASGQSDGSEAKAECNCKGKSKELTADM